MQIEPYYIVGVFETQLLVGRISRANCDRARITLTQRPGPSGELLEGSAYGTRTDILTALGEEIDPEDFEHADALYAANPTHQFLRDRSR